MPKFGKTPNLQEKIKPLRFADPDSNKEVPVSVLIGTDLFSKILIKHTIQLEKNLPFAIQTIA